MDRLEFADGIARARFAEHRLVVTHDIARAAEQGARRRARIVELEAFAERLVGNLDAQLRRFVRADYQADRFSYTVNEPTILDAERFDNKLVLLTSADDLSGAQIIERYKSLVDFELGSSPISRSQRSITDCPSGFARTRRSVTSRWSCTE